MQISSKKQNKIKTSLSFHVVFLQTTASKLTKLCYALAEQLYAVHFLKYFFKNVPAVYTRPPSRVTRSASLFFILVIQSLESLPSTQEAPTCKLLLVAVSSTYLMKSAHLAFSFGRAHHRKLT